MNRIFRPTGFFEVPDGTEVSPFLNATDTNQEDVPWGSLGEMSVAAGRIGPGCNSWIHVHPAVTQVTLLVAGSLGIRMRDEGAAKPYDLSLTPGGAVVSEPGTLFQLRNSGDETAQVLYIVSPSYVFEFEEGELVYDDAILVAESWIDLEELERNRPFQPFKTEVIAEREASLRRLAEKKKRFWAD